MSPELLEHVKTQESFRAKAYRCPAGVWTVGYGWTHNVKPGDTITEPDALALLTKALWETQGDVLNMSPQLNGQPVARLDAVVDFVYNCGLNAYRKSTFRKRVEAHDWGAAASENARWNRGGGKVLPGLVRRRAVTSEWLLTGSHAEL